MASFVPALEGLQLYTEGIGACAAILTTAAFTPQVIRTWRTGGAGLSWLMLIMLAAGAWTWFLYGLLRASVPIVAANGLTGLQILFLAGLKAWHARKAESNPPTESADFAESSEASQ